MHPAGRARQRRQGPGLPCRASSAARRNAKLVRRLLRLTKPRPLEPIPARAQLARAAEYETSSAGADSDAGSDGSAGAPRNGKRRAVSRAPASDADEAEPASEARSQPGGPALPASLCLRLSSVPWARPGPARALTVRGAGRNRAWRYWVSVVILMCKQG